MPLLLVCLTNLVPLFHCRFSTTLVHAGSSVQPPSLSKSLLRAAFVALLKAKCYSSCEVFFPFCVFSVDRKDTSSSRFFPMKVVRALVLDRLQFEIPEANNRKFDALKDGREQRRS